MVLLLCFYLPDWLGSNSDKCFFYFVSFLIIWWGLSNCFVCIIFGWCPSPMFSRRVVANDGEADAENGTSGLRRACSLSDLSKPSPRRLLPSPPNNGIPLIQFFFFCFLFRCCAFLDASCCFGGLTIQWVKPKVPVPWKHLEFLLCFLSNTLSLLWRVVESSQLTLNCFRVVNHYYSKASSATFILFSEWSYF